jgi:FtsH-binding integral membrane protein
MSEYSITSQGDESPQSPGGVDAVKYEQFMRDARSKQSMALALLGGLLASVVAAFIWALITYVTHYQIGFMAVGVGLLVGFAVKYFGNGMSSTYGVIGAVFALFGCLLGNILAAIIGASLSDGIPILAIVSAFVTSPGIVIEILKETFSPIDLLFYGLAVYEGFKFSVRHITEEELAGLQKDPPPPAPQPPPAAPPAPPTETGT